MDVLSSSARRELVMLVPAALQHHISCFAFCDEHPSDKRPFEVVICTHKGEVLELYRREVIISVSLGDGLIPREIIIYRNDQNLKYYLVSTFENLFVISTEDHLNIFKRIDNVERFVLDDPFCTGTARVRLWYNDDAVPIILDDHFENTGDNVETSPECADNGSAFLSSLKSKLTEARHTVACNERRYRDLLQFRQAASHTLLQDVCPNSQDSVFKSCQKLHEALIVTSSTILLKMCNGKVVLEVTICNETDRRTFSDIKLILQCDTSSPLVYHTEMYSAMSSAPFYQRKLSEDLLPKSKAFIVAITDIPQFSTRNRLQYKGVIVYQMEGLEKFLPLDAKELSCLDTLNESFDLLSSNELGDSDFLAILASTFSVKLQVLLVPALSDANPPDLITIFVQYMKMERVGSTDNVLIHRTSPYHVLHGVMVMVDESEKDGDRIINRITVFVRDRSQLSSLLHLIYDGIPYRLLVTIRETTIAEKSTSKIAPTMPGSSVTAMDIDNVLVPSKDVLDTRWLRYGESLSAQLGIVLQYFDECMVAMASSKNSEVVQLIGTEIDILAAGSLRHAEFVSKLNDEIRKGNKLIN